MTPKGEPNPFTSQYLTLKKRNIILRPENLFLVLPCWNREDEGTEQAAELLEGNRVSIWKQSGGGTKPKHSAALAAARLDQNH